MIARERLVLDAAILVAILAAANPASTGMLLHELIGFAVIVPALLHLVINWDWVVRSATRFLDRLRVTSRINLIVDAGLFASLVGVTLSGILVVPGMGAALGLDVNGAWHAVHLMASNLTIAFALSHLALHAKRILDVLNRPAPSPRTVRPAEQH